MDEYGRFQTETGVFCVLESVCHALYLLSSIFMCLDSAFSLAFVQNQYGVINQSSSHEHA